MTHFKKTESKRWLTNDRPLPVEGTSYSTQIATDDLKVIPWGQCNTFDDVFTKIGNEYSPEFLDNLQDCINNINVMFVMSNEKKWKGKKELKKNTVPFFKDNYHLVLSLCDLVPHLQRILIKNVSESTKSYHQGHRGGPSFNPHSPKTINWEACNTVDEVIRKFQQHYTDDVIQALREDLDHVKLVFGMSNTNHWKGKREIKKRIIPYYINNYGIIVSLFGIVPKLETISLKISINKLTHEIQELKAISHQMETKADQYEKECMNLAPINEQLKLTEKEYKQYISTTTNIYSDLEKTQNELDYQQKKAKRETDQLKKELSQSKTQITHCRNELSQRDKELADCKHENGKLKNDVNIYKQERDSLKYNQAQQDGEIANLNEGLRVQSRDLKMQDEAIKRKEQQCQQLAHEIESMKNIQKEKDRQIQEKNRLIQERDKHIQEKDKHIHDISMKLAAEMSTKLSADERAVENVSIKNRPMNVAEEYQMVCSNQWLDAKGAVDECAPNVPNYQRLQLLCHIIEVAESETRMVVKEIFDSLHSQMYDPINFILGQKLVGTQTSNVISHPNNHHTTLKEKKVPTEFSNMLGDQLKLASDNVNIYKLIQQVYLKLDNMDSQPKKEIWDKSKESQQVQVYLASVVRIIWKMVIQRPAMEFKLEDNFRGENFQEVFWNSDAVQNPAVITVYPMLYHGESLMAKGKVLLLDPKKQV